MPSCAICSPDNRECTRFCDACGAAAEPPATRAQRARAMLRGLSRC